MAPNEFSLRIQHGITGGFAPPTPNAIHTLTKTNKDNTLLISSATRDLGTPHLQDAAPKFRSLDVATDALVTELHSILKELPTEQPQGSEDIYGLDTSIGWGSEDLEWCNGGPDGCGGGNSSVKATEEEKVKFERAVEIVNEIMSS